MGAGELSASGGNGKELRRANMWRQIAREVAVVAAGTAFLLFLAATWGLPADETSSRPAAAGPLLTLRPRADVDPALIILEGWRKCGTSDSVCADSSR